jgi:hypothetical protein
MEEQKETYVNMKGELIQKRDNKFLKAPKDTKTLILIIVKVIIIFLIFFISLFLIGFYILGSCKGGC